MLLVIFRDKSHALQPYLSGTENAERTLTVNAIRAITGEAFAPQTPKDEKEWDQVNTQVEKWVKDWEIKKQEALRSVEDKLKKAVADKRTLGWSNCSFRRRRRGWWNRDDCPFHTRL